jgi:uncharacterized glyoxalase superfamily protein PhnB
MFNKLAAIAIKVTNFNKALNFYTNTLNLTVHIEDRDNEFAELVLGDTLLALLTNDTLRDMSENINFVDKNSSTFLFAVEVNNLEETHNELKEDGVNLIQQPKSTPWGQKVAYFKDPEGYIWEISESSEK